MLTLAATLWVGSALADPRCRKAEVPDTEVAGCVVAIDKTASAERYLAADVTFYPPGQLPEEMRTNGGSGYFHFTALGAVRVGSLDAEPTDERINRLYKPTHKPLAVKGRSDNILLFPATEATERTLLKAAVATSCIDQRDALYTLWRLAREENDDNARRKLRRVKFDRDVEHPWTRATDIRTRPLLDGVESYLDYLWELDWDPAVRNADQYEEVEPCS